MQAPHVTGGSAKRSPRTRPVRSNHRSIAASNVAGYHVAATTHRGRGVRGRWQSAVPHGSVPLLPSPPPLSPLRGWVTLSARHSCRSTDQHSQHLDCSLRSGKDATALGEHCRSRLRPIDRHIPTHAPSPDPLRAHVFPCACRPATWSCCQRNGRKNGFQSLSSIGLDECKRRPTVAVARHHATA